MIKKGGLIGSTLFFVVALAISLIGWIDPTLTVSRHIASYELAIWIFRFIGVFSSILISVNLLVYVKSKYKFDNLFFTVAVVVCISLFLICIFPKSVFISDTIHDMGAYGLFIFGQALSIIVTLRLWQQSNLGLKVFGILFFIYAITCAVMFFVDQLWFGAHIFYIESVYLLMLFTLIAILSYLRPTTVAKETK